jgi:amino acid adenylation domain-containing protein
MVAHLKNHLPEYMVPRLWVELDVFPMTATGKIDRLALPPADFSDHQTSQYVAPRNQTEMELVSIWRELLGVDTVGIYDNFFELGGHSLLAMRMRSQINRKLNMEISIRDLFLYPRIADLTTHALRPTGVEERLLITRQRRPDYIPLSYSQERLWFIDRLNGSTQYHLPSVLHLQGEIDLTALEGAIRDVVDRHEVLRTVFKEHEGQGYQIIKPAGKWKLRHQVLSGFSDEKDATKALIDQLIAKPFDLSADDMLRADVIRLADNSHLLIMTMHHIAADAWSMPVMVREIVALYDAYSKKQKLVLPQLPLQFADYAIWQRNNLQESQVVEKLRYWEIKLQDVQVLQLPTDGKRSAGEGKRGATLLFDIDVELTNALNLLGRQHEATLYMTLLSAFNVLLYNYTGQEDICVGTSIAGRPQLELEGLIGFFVNTLALRSNVKENEPFLTLLAQVKQTTLDAYSHLEVPFEKIVEAVVKERITGISPLFQVMLVLGNTPALPEVALEELKLSGYDHGYSEVKFDLTFFITESNDTLQCALQYNADIFCHARMDAMVGHFKNLLAAVVVDPEMPVGKLPILSRKQHEQLLNLGRNVCSYPKDKTITDVFQSIALARPTDTAVIFEGTTISYHDLDVRSNQLAYDLQRYGVKKDTLVPLYIERGIDMLVGIIGILKSGGAYVPIDTDYPQERISYIFEDTGAVISVSSRKHAPGLMAISPLQKVVILEELNANLTDEPAAVPNTGMMPQQLAYVIYTSGSTGKPKGVQVTHQNITDYVYGLDERIQISKCKTFALVSTVATDLGNTVLYGSLLFGGTLHVFAKDTASNAAALHAYFNNYRIDCVKIVPSHWKALSDDEPLVPAQMIIFGGESLTGEVVRKIRSYSSCRIINHYGPTETTIGKLLYEVTEVNDVLPIGKPFSNTVVYIVNKHLQLCPIGVPGQLLIGGGRFSPWLSA